MASKIFEILKTTSSEVVCKNAFINRYTTFIPDLFLIFCFVHTFLTAAVLDSYFIYILFSKEKRMVFAIVFTLTVISSIFYSPVLVKIQHKWGVAPKNGGVCLVNFIMVLLRMEFTFMSVQVLRTAFKKTSDISVHSIYFHIFNMHDQSLPVIKIYCFLSAIFRSIPQLFVVPIFLMVAAPEDQITVGQAIIFNNMIVYSFTIAILFPVRKSPRVFSSVLAFLLNAISKFLATMTSCGLFLIFLTQMFKAIGYYTLIFHLIKILICFWPCWNTIKVEFKTFKKTLLYFSFLGPTLGIMFGIMYIHPFAGRGYSFYYFLCTLNFIFHIFSLYVFTKGATECGILLLTLVILNLGFLSTFGLVNVLHKKDKNWMSLLNQHTTEN